MKQNIRALTLASYLSMLFLGVSSTLIGGIARNIELTPFQIGLFLTIQNVGFGLAVWASGALADTYPKPRILMIGSLILAFSLLAFYATGIFWLNLLIMLCIGIGIGSYEGVTDVMLLDLHQEKQALQINVNHFFVTLGSIIITVYLIFLDVNWRNSLYQSAAIVFALALLYAWAKMDKSSAQAEPYLRRIQILSRERLVVALFIASLLVVGVELGTTGILTTYLMELRGFSQATSKLGLVTFLAGIAIGRIVFGFLSPNERITQSILGLFGFATLVFGLMYWLNWGQWIYISLFLAGFAMSALLPLMITLAGIIYPHMAGTVVGSIKVAIPLGGIFIPFVMSLVARGTSLQVALTVFPIALLLAFVILSMAFRHLPAASDHQVSGLGG